ncbi:MAG TPA: hypothetical protein VFV38_06155 [Ktedonobacteraceae bacterium]|nr:hypothetical protein [Ktedonobacteraceae bacterium]
MRVTAVLEKNDRIILFDRPVPRPVNHSLQFVSALLFKPFMTLAQRKFPLLRSAPVLAAHRRVAGCQKQATSNVRHFLTRRMLLVDGAGVPHFIIDPRVSALIGLVVITSCSPESSSEET